MTDTPPGLYLCCMSLPSGGTSSCSVESVSKRLIQYTSPPGCQAFHLELIYVFKCPGPRLGQTMCPFALACRHVRMTCTGCGAAQVYSGQAHHKCGVTSVFACELGDVHTLSITSRKWKGARSPVRGKYISGVDVQLNRLLLKGRDKFNNWDSYQVCTQDQRVDDVILNFSRACTMAVIADQGANRYNYMSVLLNLCQLMSNPTSYFGRGRPCIRALQSIAWVACCCVTDTSNPFFPSEEQIVSMSIEQAALEPYTCATLVHVILLRLGAIQTKEMGIMFGSVHPGQLVMVAKSRHWQTGLLHSLVCGPSA